MCVTVIYNRFFINIDKAGIHSPEIAPYIVLLMTLSCLCNICHISTLMSS